jgi:hypothetical protein
MTSVAILTAVAALGVHWGWQPVAGGGIEYIIRIDPYSIDSLKDGHDVFSNLPPTLPEIRSYRITVSDQPVPHEGEPPPARSMSVSAAKPPGDATGKPSLAGDAPQTRPGGSRLFPPPKAASSTGPAIVQPNHSGRDPWVKPAAASEPAAVIQHPAAASHALSAEKPAASTAVAPSASERAPTSEQGKPWLALAGALVVLFASLAANVWLVWTALEFRAKYLAQVAKLKPAG